METRPPAEGQNEGHGWRLREAAAPEGPRSWRLVGSFVHVGRAPDCEVRLGSPYVAYHHARLSWDASEGTWILESLNRPVGLLWNGRPLEGRAALRAGDRIEVGDVVLLYEREPGPVEGPPPEDVLELTSCLVRGALSEVWEGRFRGRPVCVKRARRGPRTTPPAAEVFRADWSICFSRLVSLLGASGRIVEDAPAEELLASEAERIQASSGAWNHEVLALVDLPDGGRGCVLPRHEGLRLDRLSREAKRKVLPLLLPALWDALAAASHGDLQGGNVLVAPDGSAFHLIDPCSSVRRTKLFAPPDSRQELVFVTSPRYYPLLPPYHASSLSLAEGHALADHLEDFLRGLSMASRPFAAGRHTVGVAFRPRSVGVGAKAYPLEPHPADLQALGILYYEALARRHPLFDGGFPAPDWLGGRVEDHRAIGFDAARARAKRPIVSPRTFAADVRVAEERLALALLALAVPRREALAEMAADAARPA